MGGLNMLKLKKTVALIALAVTTTFAGCTTSKTADVKQITDNKKPKQTLTIGIMPAIDSVACTIAKEKKYFDKYGVDVKLEVFKSAKDRDAAFQAGKLDGVSTDEVAVALYQNAGIDLKITGVADGDFLLIASKDSGIKSINDIKGKSISISQNSVIEYTLDRMLEENSIKPEEVEKTIIPAIPIRLEMLRSNKVDLALLPEPFATFALNDGGILLDKATNHGLSPTVYAFTKKSIDEKSEEIKAFYKAYNDSVNYINNNSISEFEDVVIEAAGYPEDMKGKIALPKYRINVLPTEKEIQDAIDWSANKGIITKKLTPKDMVSDVAFK
jgi:NitT/TauT family transport system substrate-binding protein